MLYLLIIFQIPACVNASNGAFKKLSISLRCFVGGYKRTRTETFSLIALGFRFSCSYTEAMVLIRNLRPFSLISVLPLMFLQYELTLGGNGNVSMSSGISPPQPNSQHENEPKTYKQRVFS